MALEKTYIMLKPDAVKRLLIGEIISRIERKGYCILQAKLMELNTDIIAEHYAHLLDRDFYPELESFMLSGPVFAMIVEGPDAIQGMRSMIGPTDIAQAAPGTIRGDYANSTTYNIIHGSDARETAEVEIQRFFG